MMSSEGVAGKDLRRLCSLAVSSKSKAYCPYSHFQVGAALLGADGEFYTGIVFPSSPSFFHRGHHTEKKNTGTGCNVENASFGLCICAERTAIVKAVSCGCTRFAGLAIAMCVRFLTPTPHPTCRQFPSSPPQLWI